MNKPTKRIDQLTTGTPEDTDLIPYGDVSALDAKAITLADLKILSRGYRVYVARIITGTNSITVYQELENDFGTVNWEYAGVGSYYLRTPDTNYFDFLKTVYTQNYMLLTPGLGGDISITWMSFNDTNWIEFGAWSYGSNSGSDSVFSDTVLIEVRAYL